MERTEIQTRKKISNTQGTLSRAVDDSIYNIHKEGEFRDDGGASHNNITKGESFFKNKREI
jgi:hypothetical protein